MYGTTDLVAIRIGDIVANREFTTETNPTLAQVEGTLRAVSAEMDAELEAAGYSTPIPIVAQSNRQANKNYFRDYVDYVASCGAAARLLSFRPAQSYNTTNQTRSGGDRREMLDRELIRFIAMVRKGHFNLPRERDLTYPFCVITGQEDKAHPLGSAFTRDKFSNLTYQDGDNSTRRVV